MDNHFKKRLWDESRDYFFNTFSNRTPKQPYYIQSLLWLLAKLSNWLANDFGSIILQRQHTAIRWNASLYILNAALPLLKYYIFRQTTVSLGLNITKLN